MFDCPSLDQLAVPVQTMAHVVRVESGFNPYAIGVVRGRLARQPRNLAEAVATANMLERLGYNFSLGIAQVNRYNLVRYGLGSYAKAFETCPNLQAGARILRECHDRAGDWGKAFSCYYSGNFTTGFRHSYVQKVMAGMKVAQVGGVAPIAVIPAAPARAQLLRRAPGPAPHGRPALQTDIPSAPKPHRDGSAAGSAEEAPAAPVSGDSAFVF